MLAIDGSFLDFKQLDLLALRQRTREIIAPLQEEVTLTEDMVTRNLVPRVELLRLKSRLAELSGDLSVSVASEARLTASIREAENQINAIPLDDERSYELYARAKTVAVFQVESSGMMDALRRMKPTTIEDIVALVALYRPGPMENIPKYCEVKNGLRERESIHPMIDHILEETQGIIVYQEQVMEIARKMAGYSLGGADLLRRAMGKKDPAKMAKERSKFVAGCARTNQIGVTWGVPSLEKPNGLPMAMTVSPIMRSSELPIGIAGTGSLVSMRRTARSKSGAAPTTSATNSRSSINMTLILLLLAITCSLVRI